MHSRLAFLFCVVTAACGSGDPAVSEAPEPVTATAVASSERAEDLPHVTTPAGKRIDLEVASTAASRARGLMFRDHLPRGRGMIFVFPTEEIQGFWMKNTLIPLDILWIDSAGAIVHIERDVPPCRADPCPTYSSPHPARYVLELAAGEAAHYTLEPGQRLALEGIESYRVE